MSATGEAAAGSVPPPPPSGNVKDKEDEELAKRTRRKNLKVLNTEHSGEGTSLLCSHISCRVRHSNRCCAVPALKEPLKNLDSSLKRHTALIKRMRQSLATDNYEHIMKDIASLSLEKYVDELASAVVEGVARCKTERDVWSAVEVRMHADLAFISTTDLITACP